MVNVLQHYSSTEAYCILDNVLSWIKTNFVDDAEQRKFWCSHHFAWYKIQTLHLSIVYSINKMKVKFSKLINTLHNFKHQLLHSDFWEKVSLIAIFNTGHFLLNCNDNVTFFTSRFTNIDVNWTKSLTHLIYSYHFCSYCFRSPFL